LDRNKMLNEVLQSDKWESFEIIGDLRVAISQIMIMNNTIMIKKI